MCNFDSGLNRYSCSAAGMKVPGGHKTGWTVRASICWLFSCLAGCPSVPLAVLPSRWLSLPGLVQESEVLSVKDEPESVLERAIELAHSRAAVRCSPRIPLACDS